MAYTHEDFLIQVEKLVGKEYTVLGTYKTVNDKILMRHNKCGYEYEVTPNKFKQGRRCPKCSGLIKITHNEFLQQIYDLVKDEYTVCSRYKSTNEKIKMKHNTCGLIYEVTPSHFKDGNRCPKCSKISKRKSNTNEFIQKVYKLVKDEYTVVSEYTTNKDHVLMRHNTCGYEWKIRPDIFSNGTRCPKCTCHSGVSNKEKEILDFIKSFYNGEIIENNKSILNGKELDIYIPNKNLAIEFNGLYWHSEAHISEKNYHLDKTVICKNQNIRLIHIFEDEWNFKQDIVKSKLKHILGYNDNPRIRASKCYIEEIDSKTKNQFLNENHIQGEDKASIKLGLWYPINEDEDRLIAVMTFCKPRFTKNYDYELSRFAIDINYQVYGAFDKLFKYFKENYNWKSIVTYADRRWSTTINNNIYENNSFNLIDISDPSYYYTDRVNRKNRVNFQKHKLKKLFPDLYDENLTEFQIMDKTSYQRIWDCGNYVYEYKR